MRGGDPENHRKTRKYVVIMSLLRHYFKFQNIMFVPFINGLMMFSVSLILMDDASFVQYLAYFVTMQQVM